MWFIEWVLLWSCQYNDLRCDLIISLLQVRLYDVRSGQRRPVTELRWPDAKDEEASNTALAAVERDQVLVGTNTGTIGLWDFRAGRGYRGLVRKYGGSVGAVRDIATQPGGLFI